MNQQEDSSRHDIAGNVIQTHEHAGGFQGVVRVSLAARQTSRYTNFHDSAFTGDLENSSPTGKCILSGDVEIEGSITFQKELLIDGKVQGQITSDGALTIGENADIRGEIKTKSVTVHGKVHGNITAERCELKSKCNLQGDLKLPSHHRRRRNFFGNSQISAHHEKHS